MIVIMRNILIASFISLGVIAYTVTAAPAKKVKNYEGIITQVNAVDGDFVMRLRDGSLVAVKNPLAVNMFISIRGVLDTTNKTLTDVAELKIKDSDSSDALPIITMLNPGAGIVGTTITITGTGFTKKYNTISVGDVANVAINLPSKDKKTLAFDLPPILCNQKLKISCHEQSRAVPPEGNYNIVVTNEHGLSNPVPFHILPLPPLAITTQSLPQVVAGTWYKNLITAVGGAFPRVWQISAGALPPGLTLDATGAIVGIPTAPGVYTSVITITSGGETTSKQFSITVVQALSS